MNPEKTEIGDNITVPPIPNGQVNGEAKDSDLLAMQQKRFAKPVGKQTEIPTGEGEGEVKTDEPKPPKARAREIFEKTQKATKKIKTSEPKQDAKPKEETEGGEFDGELPEFDTTRFIPDGDESAGESGDTKPKGAEESTEPTPEAVIDVNKESNIKRLRGLVASERQRREELEEQLKSRPEASAYQDKLRALENRVKELEPFEVVFALHKNPKFKQRFIDQPNTLVGEMKKIAKDYDVEESVIGELVASSNRKDIDAILEESFPSSSARSDLKTLKQKYDGIVAERREWEQKPEQTLAQLHNEDVRLKAESERQRKEIFPNIVEEAWSRAVEETSEVAKKDRLYELLEIPGNKKHNEKVAQPTLRDARNLMQNGLTHIERMIQGGHVIDPGFASWFARICQQAAATRMINYTRLGLWEENQALKSESEKRNGHDRPGLNTPSRGSSVKSGPDKKKLDGKQVAAEIFEAVLRDHPDL